MRGFKGVYFVVLFFVLLFAVSCSSNTTGGDATSSVDTNQASSQEAQVPSSQENTTASADSDWNAVIEAAKKEGKVVVGAPPGQGYRDVITKFEEAYPGIKVELSGLTPGEFEPKVTSERQAHQFLWDIWISGIGGTVFTEQIPNGWYQPIRSVIRDDIAVDDVWTGGFESGFLDDEKQYVFDFGIVQFQTIFVNRDIVPESEFNSYEDLFDPKWKGKIAMRDPRGRGAGRTTLAFILDKYGEEKVKQLLVDQEVVVSGTPQQLVDWGVRGNYPIVIGMTRVDLSNVQKQGVGLNVKPVQLEANKTIITPESSAMMLMDKSPHPNAAKLFINWLLSKETQTLWGKHVRTNSRRADVPPADPSVAVDENLWENATNLNREESADLLNVAQEMAKELIK